ncbi:ATP-binding protein [Streptomyces sp. NPDC088194]|uniref:ATP-binding protein n=1 Tax=Streptomyces sp. NPDC088194 TaxID=3154931 RepID=UPI00344CA7B7
MTTSAPLTTSVITTSVEAATTESSTAEQAAEWRWCEFAGIALPAAPRQVGRVRRYVARVLSVWGIQGDDQERLVLISSELAANAALHGRTDLHVRLAHRACGAVRLEVVDTGARRPVLPPREEDEHGRGLEIVAALAECVSTTRTADGTRVIVEVCTDATSACGW